MITRFTKAESSHAVLSALLSILLSWPAYAASGPPLIPVVSIVPGTAERPSQQRSEIVKFVIHPRAGQAFEEYRSSLRQAAKKIRLKVMSRGDAYYVPGANLETVQKRALREGRVTTLNPRVRISQYGSVPGDAGSVPLAAQMEKPVPVENRISELDPSAGKWKVNSTRFEGITPVYDKRNAFGVAVQNLRQMIEHADDPVAFMKYFNRMINEGAGAGFVNSYRDIHACGLPDEPLSPIPVPLAPNDDVIRDAFLLEGGLQRQPQTKWQYDQIIGTKKQFAKARWIIRAFGLDIRTPPEVFRRLYETVEISTRIEYAKLRGEFDWKHPDRGRSVFLRSYFDAAVANLQKIRPELLDASTPTDTYLDAAYEEAWKMYTRSLRDTVGQILVRKYIEAVRDSEARV